MTRAPQAKLANLFVLMGFFAGCGEQSMTVDATASSQQVQPRTPTETEGQITKMDGSALQARGMRHSTNDTELAVRPATTGTKAKQAALTGEERLAACEDYEYLSEREQAELESVCLTQP